MIATLVCFGAPHRPAAPGGAARVGLGGRQRAAVRRAAAGRVARRARPALRARHGVGARAHGRAATSCPVFVSRGVVQISAYVDTLLASLLPTGAVTGLLERAAALHAAGQPVRHVGVGRGTAGDVRRGERRSGGDRRGPPAPRRRAAADRVLRRAVGDGVSSRSATSSPPRCCRPGASATPTPSTSGASSPARPSACWRRRSAVCIRRPTTRCATRGRRCATRSCASR